MTWIVDHIYPAAKWSIVNTVTGQRKVIGPAGHRRVNYFDKAVRKAERRNAVEKQKATRC